MCMGPDDFNGYGYFVVRLYCTCLGFQANIVEEYVLLSALQHIFASLKRTRDQKLSSGLMSGQLSSAITGLMLLTFTATHLLTSRPTLRSRSPCASWAPPLTGGLCGDLSPHRTTMTQTKCCPILHFGTWWLHLPGRGDGHLGRISSTRFLVLPQRQMPKTTSFSHTHLVVLVSDSLQPRYTHMESPTAPRYSCRVEAVLGTVMRNLRCLRAVPLGRCH